MRQGRDTDSASAEVCFKPRLDKRSSIHLSVTIIICLGGGNRAAVLPGTSYNDLDQLNFADPLSFKTMKNEYYIP